MGMAKVYVSSTIADLEPERRAVMDWLVAARHQPVHSYLPSSDTVRDSCLDDVDACDLYVLILGHRYGFVPEEGNPEGLSITDFVAALGQILIAVNTLEPEVSPEASNGLADGRVWLSWFDWVVMLLGAQRGHA